VGGIVGGFVLDMPVSHLAWLERMREDVNGFVKT